MPKKRTPRIDGEAFMEHVGETSTEAKAFAPNLEAESVKATAKPRFSVTLKEDGSIDTASMRAETVNRLKEILRDPRTQQLLGPELTAELVSDQDVKMLYDMVAMIEAYAFTLAGKIDFDIAQKHAAWTEQQKSLVMQPTKNVIAKNADKLAVALRWKDEVVLAMLFLTISRAKFEGARKEQKERNEERTRENPATSGGAEAVQ